MYHTRGEHTGQYTTNVVIMLSVSITTKKMYSSNTAFDVLDEDYPYKLSIEL
jgi:hypothetical protein